jgi:hypothetical protein
VSSTKKEFIVLILLELTLVNFVRNAFALLVPVGVVSTVVSFVQIFELDFVKVWMISPFTVESSGVITVSLTELVPTLLFPPPELPSTSVYGTLFRLLGNFMFFNLALNVLLPVGTFS